MIDRQEVAKLAELSRLSLSDEELAELAEDIKQVLVHVADVGAFQEPAHTETISGVTNVLREDGEPHAAGSYTDELVGAFPNEHEGYAKVKKIITRE